MSRWICSDCGQEYAHGVGIKCYQCWCKDQPDCFTCKKCGQLEVLSRVKDLKNTHFCQDCNFWQRFKDLRDDPKMVRAGGKHYYICSEEGPSPDRRFLGFEGRKFKIIFKDGRKVVSSNLWRNGDIPLIWQFDLPDNAKLEEVWP